LKSHFAAAAPMASRQGPLAAALYGPASAPAKAGLYAFPSTVSQFETLSGNMACWQQGPMFVQIACARAAGS
jgi:hypothetical protein